MIFPKNSNGFTLIEVLSAFLILIVVIVPLTYVFAQGSRGAAVSGGKTAALNFAQQKMEEIIAEGEAVEEKGIINEMPSYTYVVSVVPDKKMYLVTVTVSYKVLGKSRKLSLSTLISGG
ncbi:MAG: hypothetical protein XD50_0678 [Clostridia bacterium 41_269]|nr:MAG: hypothetical protein XD50_0678 [Clostridia bacterium 41_269]